MPPTLLDPRPRSNAFVSAIAKPLPCRETRRQKGLDLAYWPLQFRNDPYIAGRNNSNLGMSSHNIGRKTKPLGAIRGVRSLPEAGHVLGL